MAIRCFELCIHFIRDMDRSRLPDDYYSPLSSNLLDPQWLCCHDADDPDQNSLIFGYFSTYDRGDVVIRALRHNQEQLRLGTICIYRLREVTIPGQGMIGGTYYLLDHFFPDSIDEGSNRQPAVRYDYVEMYLNGEITLTQTDSDPFIIYHKDCDDEAKYLIDYV